MKLTDLIQIMIVIIVAVVGTVMGIMTGIDSAQAEAIEAGVAEYYLDENNDKKFRYLERCKE